MKKIFLITLITMTVYTAAQAAPGEVNFDKDASYAVGLNIGFNLREGMTADSVYPDINELLIGMRDGIENRRARFDLETARELIESAFNALTERLGTRQAVPGVVNFDRNASYAVGLNLGASIREGMINDGVYPDINEFIIGMRDGFENRRARFDLETANELIETAFNTVTEKIRVIAMQKEIDYLAENARKPGVQRTQSGLQYQIITDRRGRRPTRRDTVMVHYEAKFTDGTIFDSTYERGEPLVFELIDSTPGLQEGLQMMSVGSKYILTIPSALGYGEEATRDLWTGEIIIPQHSVLIYEVELLQINP